MVANPDLHAAAERFVQARDRMIMARSRRIPHLGIGGKATDSRNSVDTSLYKDPDTPLTGSLAAGAGLASWEPDFWSAIRNATRVELHRAQERAADWGLARLSLQAEIASDYFTLRGFDAQAAIYRKSIELFQRVVKLVKTQYEGALASALDVARVESLLFSTQTKLAEIQGRRKVTEQSIAILLNMAPASFSLEPVDKLHVESFKIPRSIPSHLTRAAAGHCRNGTQNGRSQPDDRYRASRLFPRRAVLSRWRNPQRRLHRYGYRKAHGGILVLRGPGIPTGIPRRISPSPITEILGRLIAKRRTFTVRRSSRHSAKLKAR